MKAFLRRHVLFGVFSFFFLLLHFGGYLFALIMSSYGIDKVYADHWVSHLIPLGFYLLFSISYFLIYSRVKVPSLEIGFESFYKKYAFYVFIAAFLFYFMKQGLVISKSGGYENRYESNVGLGVVSQLLIFFYFGYSIWIREIIASKSIVRLGDFRFAIFVALLFAFSTFALLGGHRQLGFGVVFVLIYVFYLQGYIKLHQVAVSSIGALILITLVAVYRYDNLDLDDRGVMFYLVIFLFDGLTPLNAYFDVFNDVVAYGKNGIETAINQFAYIIPRSVWQDKPIIIMNGGNYYTQEILGRSGLVTYSPTLLGELMIVHGIIGAILIAPAVALFVAVYDKVSSTHSVIGFILIALTPLIAFNLYREGFYVVITKMFLISMFLLAFYVSGRVILPIIYKKVTVRI